MGLAPSFAEGKLRLKEVTGEPGLKCLPSNHKPSNLCEDNTMSALLTIVPQVLLQRWSSQGLNEHLLNEYPSPLPQQSIARVLHGYSREHIC